MTEPAQDVAEALRTRRVWVFMHDRAQLVPGPDLTPETTPEHLLAEGMRALGSEHHEGGTAVGTVTVFLHPPDHGPAREVRTWRYGAIPRVEWTAFMQRVAACERASQGVYVVVFHGVRAATPAEAEGAASIHYGQDESEKPLVTHPAQ